MGSTPSKDASSASTSTSANSSTSAWQSDQTVDHGALLPHGIYHGAPQDYDYRVVRKLISERRLAPFYKGLSDEPIFEDTAEDESTALSPTLTDPLPMTLSVGHKKPDSLGKSRERTFSNNSSMYSSMASETLKLKQKLETERKKLFVEKKLYKDAVECPICFLYYPANTNHSRCCAQPICTECFIQIKRPPEAPSTPASCPFCVEPNFGVYYKPPDWAEKSVEKRAIVSSGVGASIVPTASVSTASTASTSQKEDAINVTGNPEKKARRKTMSHQDPEVVTIDMIRPDWNRLLDVPMTRSRPESRRNSLGSSTGSTRRIIVRPNSSNTSSRGTRSSSSAAAAEYSGYLAAMRHMNMDLEELMVMEAVRLSLLEQEETQRRDRESPAAEGVLENADDTSNNTATTSSNDASQTSDDADGAGTSGTVVVTDTDQNSPVVAIVSDDSDDSDDDEPLVRAHLFQQRVSDIEDDDGASTSNPPPFPPRLSSEQNAPTTPPPPHEDGGSSASKDVKAPIDDESNDRTEGATEGSRPVY